MATVGEEGGESVEKKSPSDFLRHVIGRPVIVKLVSGITYHGILAWCVVFSFLSFFFVICIF
jgi:hypothetical protein